MIIFDHSWYGRVLEERVEHIIPEKAWRQASATSWSSSDLADDGTTILKFFFHISKKEQKKRFEAIEADPLEAWRVTDGDWARYKKYDEYAAASEEMLEQTDTEFPLDHVEATSKWYARKKLFETIIAALEKRLGADAPPAPRPGKAASRDADLRAAMESLGGSK